MKKKTIIGAVAPTNPSGRVRCGGAAASAPRKQMAVSTASMKSRRTRTNMMNSWVSRKSPCWDTGACAASSRATRLRIARGIRTIRRGRIFRWSKIDWIGWRTTAPSSQKRQPRPPNCWRSRWWWRGATIRSLCGRRLLSGGLWSLRTSTMSRLMNSFWSEISRRRIKSNNDASRIKRIEKTYIWMKCWKMMTRWCLGMMIRWRSR